VSTPMVLPWPHPIGKEARRHHIQRRCRRGRLVCPAESRTRISARTSIALDRGRGASIDHAIAINAWYFLGYRSPRSGARLTLRGPDTGPKLPDLDLMKQVKREVQLRGCPLDPKDRRARQEDWSSACLYFHCRNRRRAGSATRSYPALMRARMQRCSAWAVVGRGAGQRAEQLRELRAKFASSNSRARPRKARYRAVRA
jgi:hypothetical protein